MKPKNSTRLSLRAAINKSLPDSLFLRLHYFYRTHRILRLRRPQYLAEKLQWLKVYGNLERFAPYVDKYTVREHITRKVGSDYLVPLHGVWDTFDNIPFDQLPSQFVLKVTNGCGYNYICQDKRHVDFGKLREQINAWQQEDYARFEREKQYGPCVPRIIAEKYLEDESGELRDYKFWCSKGEPKLIQVDTSRKTGHLSTNLDTDWRRRADTESYDYSGTTCVPEKPAALPEMLQVARLLSEDFPYVRVDMYLVRGKVYVGELTFTPGSGFTSRNKAAEIELGRLIDLEAYEHWQPPTSQAD